MSSNLKYKFHMVYGVLLRFRIFAEAEKILLFNFSHPYGILSRMQNSYELTLVLTSTTGDDEQKKIVDEIKKIISPNGKVTDVKDWGKKVLAYPIRNAKEGKYVFLTLKTESETVKKIDGKLRVKETVLRHLLIRKD